MPMRCWRRPPRPVDAGWGDVGVFEPLEARALLSAFSWTAQEVALSELVNRARANPQAEGQRLGLNLALGLTSQEVSRLIPREPLALSRELTLAARAHSADMAARNFFDHTNPSGQSPTDRARAAGYSGSAGENIAAGYENIAAAHRAWLLSVGHRRNVLSLWTSFTSSFHYDQFGPGMAMNAGGAYGNYYTQLFGVLPTSAVKTFLLGVVYRDTSNDDFYTAGEGAGGVRIDAALASSPGTTVATYTTDGAGNYQMALAPGSYLVTFTDLATGTTQTKTATIGGENVKVDADPRDFRAPPPPPPPPVTDDHADAGDWANATSVAVDGATGGAVLTGEIEADGDTDLFTFVSARAGATQVRFTGGGAGMSVRVFSSTMTLLGAGSSVSLTLASGQRVYVLASAGSSTPAGSEYTLTLDAPVEPPRPPVLSTLPASGQGVSTLAIGQRSIMAFVNADGLAVVGQRGAAGTWTFTELAQTAGGASVATALTAWNLGAKVHVAVATPGALLVYTLDRGAWSVRNLSAETRGNVAAGLSLGVLRPVAGAGAVLAGVNAAGQVVVYEDTGRPLSGSAGATRWSFTNVSQRFFAPRGVSTPTFAGALSPMTTLTGGLSLAGLDSAGELRLLTRGVNPAGRVVWSLANLTGATGTPTLTGSLAVFSTQAGPRVGEARRIAGTDNDGRVWLFTFRQAGGWRAMELTAAMGGVQMRPTGLAAVTDARGITTLAGVESEQRVTLFRFTPATARWTGVIFGQRPGERILGITTGPGRSVQIATLTPDGSLGRLFGGPGLSIAWAWETVSASVRL
jgi:hypothetical protein